MKSKRIKACSRVLFKTKEDVSPLTPIFKWTGGKRKEIDKFKSFFPSFVSDGTKYTYVEPFVGGGAVYFHLNNIFGKNVINDFDPLVSNFYKEFTLNDKFFASELKRIGKIKDHDLLSKEYYRLRNQDKDGGLKKLTNVEKAIRFFIVNQLAFSGMRRFNSSGEFNVPFGHYKGVNTNIVNSPEHIALLLKSEIHVGDFEPIMNNYDQDNTFMFLDPPYTREFKEYSAGNSFDEADQERLCKTIKNIKNASVMMIIDKSPLTERLYKDMIKHTYQLKYGVNIKNRFSTAVEHLIICNY
jgi:DNA adenine methylase